MNTSGFGLAIAKPEGTQILIDHLYTDQKSRIGNDWMELPIPKNASRARVHKMVAEWLDERANGFRGSM